MNSILTNSYPAHSKLWVFQSSNKINEANLKEAMSSFFNTWKSHGRSVESSFCVVKERFLIVLANEEVFKVTGCAIDELMHAVRNYSQDSGVELQDRQGFYYESDGGLKYMLFEDFKKHYESGEISNDSIYYNTSISTKGDADSAWQLSVGDSWMKARFL